MKLFLIFFFLLLGLLLTSEPAFAHEPTLIAVIDTGVDTQNPQLKKLLWKNPGETGPDKKGRDKSSNGVDDDGNGLIDDVSGWNFAGGNADLMDSHGHGTHIAGILAGVPQKLPAPKIRLMILKYYDSKATSLNNLHSLTRALKYAVRMRARIINYSGGGFMADPTEKKIIEEAGKKGILVVAAAGNEASNTDLKPFFPAGYQMNHMISVAAHGAGPHLIPASNFGAQSVDLAAPGEDIVSSLPFGQQGRMSGTSQATAFVSFACAQLMQQRPDWGPSLIKKHLAVSARYEKALAGATKSRGRLDLGRTLALYDQGRSFSGYRVIMPGVRTLDTESRLRLPAARRP